MNYVGMDIHKKFTVAVAKDKEGNKLAEEKFDNDNKNFDSFLKDFKPEETKIVFLLKRGKKINKVNSLVFYERYNNC